MNKNEYIDELRKRLSHLPQKDAEERLAFYSEIIDDRIEEGVSEEEAILGIGKVDDLAEKIVADFPLAKETKDKRKLKTWEIVLLALGSPIWMSLAVAALAVILSLYVVLWALIISLWAVFASIVSFTLAGIILGILLAFNSSAVTGIAMLGAGIACAGLSIFMFLASNALTKGLISLTQKLIPTIKADFFANKGEMQ